MRLSDEIASHYAQGVERDRLRTWGRLEALRTRELLARFLPPAPAIVLDVGGAEGAYALPLASAGYPVHLLDPLPAHVEAARAASARQTSLASAEVGDARELPFPDGAADVVLLLGPLYHLVDDTDRARALAEAHRVLRPGGRLFAAAISRFASTLDGLRAGMITEPVFEAIVENDLRTGVHRNPDVGGRPEWFTLAYFHHPDELRAEVRRGGFPDAEVFAVEGPVGQASLHVDLDDPVARDAALRAIARIEREPSLLGASPHLLAVAAKP
ncbi:MAG TPA: class I SAM-dependent methyltransferase [Amycolatopsis sp.]|nr:class I SAM-dependent methyltransferase [Amycolatopsis sp.]